MQCISVCCIRSFFFFCPCKLLSNPCFSPLRDISRLRKDIHFSLGKPQFSPIVLSFYLQETGGKSPYFSLRDSNGKRRWSRKGSATFLKFSNHFSTFSYQFLFISLVISCFLSVFREKREKKDSEEKRALLGHAKPHSSLV